MSTKKAPKKKAKKRTRRIRKIWPIDGLLLGVPPLIAGLIPSSTLITANCWTRLSARRNLARTWT